MDNILDHVVVQGQRYDIVSPTAFCDNIETIGSACINPDGYAQGSTFLAKLGNAQFYYEATAAITQGSAILEGTNCKKTTVTGREAELALEIQDLGETVDSLNEALTNRIDENTADINIIESSGNWRTGLRFKNLGTSFTSAQQTALANGDFSEFWNGDYWVIGGHNWRIVDNSGIARRKGDTNFDSNSLVIMPDDNLVVAEAYLIDDANDSGHGYNNCAYRTRTDGKGRAQCKSIISSAFGSSHIASHRELMSTARGTSGATSWAWTDADVELPSEANIYGHSAFSSGILSGCYSPGYNIGTEWGQFMLFRLAPYMAINRSQNYWLRDIVSASYFAHVSYGGGAGRDAPSATHVGLRPHFILV